MVHNNWNIAAKSKITFTKAIHDFISKEVQNNLLDLPNFRNSPELFIFSDYGGNHQQVGYHSYSFLITTFPEFICFQNSLYLLRKKYSTHDRVMNYKKLNDAVRFKALPEYLFHYDNIRGVLFSIIIDKRGIKSVFTEKGIDLNSPEFQKYTSYNRDILEKTLRIIHILSMLINGISTAGQNITWVSDEDDITANEIKTDTMLELFKWIIKDYINFPLGILDVSHPNIPGDSNKLLEEFCGIPDLAAGMLAQSQNHSPSYSPSFEQPQLIPFDFNMQEKDLILGNWLSENRNQYNLKKLTFRISGYESKLLVSKIKLRQM